MPHHRPIERREAELSPDDAFQQQILPGVSRTFALTIPQLPPPLRRAVTNAYLLCRVADTIEDEPELSAERKAELSALLVEVVDARAPAAQLVAALHPSLSQQTLPAERELVASLARVVAVTHALAAAQRAALARAIDVMSRGMSQFAAQRDPRGLADLEQLDRYCYCVAGVVGELLTELFCDHCPEIARQREQMMALAVSFGQGLQMTNILKDYWEDRARGVCWLPRDLAAAPDHGVEPLLSLTRRYLRDGLSYTLLVPREQRGIRRFCLWALGMALLCLRKINANRGYASGSEVKISRRAVRGTILATNLLAARDRSLELLFELTAAGLPQAAVDTSVPIS